MNPVIGKVSSRFGQRKHPVSKIESFHNGVDIGCPAGTNIIAPADGKILRVWTHPKGGLSLSMMTLDGIRYGFAHLHSVKVKRVQLVKEGEVIALTGNSGITTGPHLHFTVQKNGVFTDPLLDFDFGN